MPRLPVPEVAGLNPILAPVRAQEPYVIDGRNFMITVDGIEESFVYENLLAFNTADPPVATNRLAKPHGAQSIRVPGGATYLCTQDGIYTFNPVTKVLTRVYQIMTPPSTVFAWTHAHVGNFDYFARRDVGLISHNRTDDTWATETGDEATTAIACCESGGRLITLTRALVNWSAIGDGKSRATSTTTGAGFQLLNHEGVICLAFNRGFLIYTEGGITRAEITQNVIPFRILPFAAYDIRPLNSFCVVRWLNNLHVILTRQGLYVTDGIQPPQVWEPLMSEYLQSQILQAGVGETNFQMALTASLERQRLFVSLRARGAPPNIFTHAFVLDPVVNHWGQMGIEHAGVFEFVYAPSFDLASLGGFLSRDGNVCRFTEDAYNRDFTEESPTTLVDVARSSFVEIGPFRAVSQERPDKLSEMQALILIVGFSETDNECESYGICPGAVTRTEDYGDCVDSDADDKCEDYGICPTGTAKPLVSVRSTIDGQSPFNEVQAQTHPAFDQGNYCQYVMNSQGLYHNVRLTTDPVTGPYAIKLFEMTINEAGVVI